jgi:hypothetical protein
MVLEYLTSSDHGRAKQELDESANDDSTSHSKFDIIKTDGDFKCFSSICMLLHLQGIVLWN